MKQKIRRIDWNEQFKIRPRRNASMKHEHIKLAIVLRLLEKYKKNLSWIRVYTEYPLISYGKTKTADVYFENVKTKEIVCYEVQKRITDEWIKKTKEFYKKYDVPFFRPSWITVEEEKLSDDIEILDKEIEKIIV
jgi:hypothetical protein